MDILAVFATIAGLSAWTGSSIFLTFFVEPVISRKLGPGRAAEVMEFIHPRYYWLSFISGIVMLVGAGGALFIPKVRVPSATFMGLTAIALTLSIYGWLVVYPRIVSLRTRLQSSAGSAENFVVAERFDQATRLAKFLNLVVLLILLGAAAALAALVMAQDPPPGE
ncbi:MAG: hypothetical protein CMJ83_00515 [Planctomycetes bacterium]|nr:hypothetical protein [Planctomycetota bacterium]